MSVVLPHDLGPITTTSEGGGTASSRLTKGTTSFCCALSKFLWMFFFALTTLETLKALLDGKKIKSGCIPRHKYLVIKDNDLKNDSDESVHLSFRSIFREDFYEYEDKVTIEDIGFGNPFMTWNKYKYICINETVARELNNAFVSDVLMHNQGVFFCYSKENGINYIQPKSLVTRL